jgi:hypothetical protein
VPDVFVGTQEQLQALFRRHETHKTTNYGLQRVYLSESATRNVKVAELERELGLRADLQILARYLKARLTR